MVRAGGVALALSLLFAAPASAGEIFLGGFAHDSSFGVSGSPHEGGTYDYQIGVRSNQLPTPWYIGHPMVYVKGQFNTDDRTNFYTAGFEWRKHLFHTKFYGDAGIGVAYVDGLDIYPGHFDPNVVPAANASAAAVATYQTNLHTYDNRKAMGSQVVFNPNFSLGYDLTHDISAEVSWEHYSNAGLGGRNPGMDNYGARLVYHFGGPF
jgi:hypothetical protein